MPAREHFSSKGNQAALPSTPFLVGMGEEFLNATPSAIMTLSAVTVRAVRNPHAKILSLPGIRTPNNLFGLVKITVMR
jgi:hypothetical protein